MSKHHRVSQREVRSRSLRFENLEDRRLLAVVTVDTNQDVVDFTDGVTSLREAIFATNLVAGADEIQFDFGHDGPENILLTLGELAITDSLTITGPGAQLLTIDASGNDPTPDENNGDGSRIFNIDDSSFATQIDLELRSLTLTGGDISDFGGAIRSQENLSISDSTISGNSAGFSGGGIWANRATTTITDSTISGNSALFGRGGGIWSFGSLTITDSTISGNSAGDNGGGGIFARGTTTITGSTISGNSTSGNGGGIRWRLNEMTITDSTISGNSAHSGGGIHSHFGTTTITGSTISGNSAGRDGGGIYSRNGTTTITNSTISENSADDEGGGIYSDFDSTTITRSTISGNSAGRSGGGASLGNMTTITESIISDNSAGDSGGGISAGGLITITDSTVSGNSASYEGGGILTFDTATITGSTVSGNSAGRNGGGIWAIDTPTITDSTISGNSAGGDGGGIWAFFGTTTITDSTISGNSAGDNGGGIWADSRFSYMTTITNSTISGNSADNNGGGIYLNVGNGTGAISHSTIVGNVSDADQSGAGSGGGVFVRSGTLTVDHTIVAQNTDRTFIGPDITGFLGVVLDVHFSLIGNNRGTGLAAAPVSSPDANGNLIGGSVHGIIDPLLGPLADNGGPTLTHALLPGSPAIDAGVPGAVANANGIPEFDQRGFPFVRVSGGRIDIGAIEMQPLPGDFDQDGDSDGFDFLTWQRGFSKPSVAMAEAAAATSDVGYDSNDLKAWEATYGTQTVLPPALSLIVASDSPTDARLNPRLVDAALAVGLHETDHFSLGRNVTGRRVAGPRDADVVDEAFRRTDFIGPPANPASPLVARFSHHLLGSRQSADMSQELSDELLEVDLVAESFALL